MKPAILGTIDIYPASGALELRYSAAGTGTITWTTSKVWNAANDGPGSGLDADLLDGLHADGFVKFTNLYSNGTAGYVVMRMPGDSYLLIQWALISTNGATGAYNHTITFPASFGNTNYSFGKRICYFLG